MFFKLFENLKLLYDLARNFEKYIHSSFLEFQTLCVESYYFVNNFALYVINNIFYTIQLAKEELTHVE